MSFFRAILSFLRQAGMGTDLTRITTPTLFCLPESTCMVFASKRFTGFPEYRGTHKLEDPLHRFLKLLHFYLCGFADELIFGKKPLNAILGESFIAESSDGVRLIAEQVSHHPPITAFQFSDIEEKRFQFKGALEAGASFGGNSVTVKTTGAGSLTLFLDDPEGEEGGRVAEVYVAKPSLPDAVAKGLILGRKRIELNGSVELSCERTGIRMTLNFQDGRECAGAIYEDGNVVAKMKGKWMGRIAVRFVGKRKGEKVPFIKDNVLIDYKDVVPVNVQDFVLEEQAGKDSKSVWGVVLKRILAEEYAEADYAKREIENTQRQYCAALIEAEEAHEHFFMQPIEDAEEVEFELNELGEKIMSEASWYGKGRGKDKKKKHKKRSSSKKGSSKPKSPRSKSKGKTKDKPRRSSKGTRAVTAE